MQTLQSLIDLLCAGRKIHISILDLTGVLDTPLSRLEFKNTIHATPFCNAAKSTEGGYRACLRCKAMANRRAVTGAKPFSGTCVWGLTEAAHPVIVGGSTVAVVYVGGAIDRPDITEQRIEKMCRYTGALASEIIALTEKCEHSCSADELSRIAELVADYLVYLRPERLPSASPRHWLAAAMARHAEELYYTDLSLKRLASEYGKNEKYMGRLFQREMGVSFGRYCLELRLDRAARRLVCTDACVLDIAMECGFGSLSYFNRSFRRRYGLTPTAYRAAAPEI